RGGVPLPGHVARHARRAAARERSGHPRLPSPVHRAGLPRHHAHRQVHVRDAGRLDPVRHLGHRAHPDPGRRLRVRLPPDDLALVPLAVPPAARTGPDGRRAPGVRGARHARDAAVRGLAVHPAGARVLGARDVPTAPVHRLPVSRRRHRWRDPRPASGMGTEHGTEEAAMTSETHPDRAPASATVPGSTAQLALATAGFAICFWAWALLSPLGNSYGQLYSLSDFEVSVLVAVPVIVGSLGRIPVGALTDRLGARVMFPL